MCMICKSTVCPAGCPGSTDVFFNDPARRKEVFSPVSQCYSCGEDLYPGDTALIVEDYVLCRACVTEATVKLTPEGAIHDDF